VASLPGLEEGELLPASFALAADSLAAAVARAVADRPFVLVGYSTGGDIATGVAIALERDGVAPLGLVLLDTFLLDEGKPPRLFSGMMGQLLEGDRIEKRIDDRQVLAMGAYMRMLDEGLPGSVAAPSLLVKAQETLGGGLRDEGWRATDSTIEVLGNHFTIIEEHAETTAMAIETWLAKMTRPLVSTSTMEA
jgi:thioesterase domain-containing protein